MTAPTDPRAKPLAEAREDRERIVARLRASATFISDNYSQRDAANGWSNLRHVAADLIEDDGKKIAGLDGALKIEAETNVKLGATLHAVRRERASASPAPETDALRDALESAPRASPAYPIEYMDWYFKVRSAALHTPSPKTAETVIGENLGGYPWRDATDSYIPWREAGDSQPPVPPAATEDDKERQDLSDGLARHIAKMEFTLPVDRDEINVLRLVKATFDTDSERLAVARSRAPAADAEGWQTVPKVPDAAMRKAAFGAVLYGGRDSPNTRDLIYQADAIATFQRMLAAAPPPPAVRVTPQMEEAAWRAWQDYWDNHPDPRSDAAALPICLRAALAVSFPIQQDIAGATGWAVVTDAVVDVTTVSPTRRAAIINWLVTSRGEVILNHHTDEQIENWWTELRGASQVVVVTIFPIQQDADE